MWGLVERKCKWGSLGVGQMWVFWVVGGLGRVGVGGFEGVGLMWVFWVVGGLGRVGVGGFEGVGLMS